MYKRFEKTDASFSKMIIDLQSTTEKQEYARTFQYPRSTHELVATVSDDGMHISIEPVLRPQLAPVQSTGGSAEGDAGESNDDADLGKREAIIAELAGKTKEDIVTYAAEHGIAQFTAKRPTVAQMIAEIAEKLAPAKL